MNRLYPLIVCGGNGTRLWPVSRSQSPKQFQRIGDASTRTFFQSAVERHRAPGFEAPWVISSVRHRATVAAQLEEIGCAARVIHEPMGRNTGPAVLASAIALEAVDPEALMLVVPADHVIDGDLNAVVLAMAPAAAAGQIVTFGVKPRHPEPGFGYVVDGGEREDYPGLHRVARFVEKPVLRKARALVDSQTAYWSSGLSLFSVRTLIAEYERFDPDSVTAVRMAVARGRMTMSGLDLNPDFFAAASAGPTESVVFERTDRIAMAPLHGIEWSDVGSWTAMYGISRSNPQGNVLLGDVVAVDTTNSMVRSSGRLVTLVGLKDVIVIDTPDALLVTRVGHCQSVKKVAEYLKSGNRVEVESHREDRRAQQETNYGAMSPVFQSDSLEMVSAMIAPGGTLMLDPVDNREILVARGTVNVITLKSSAVLKQGQKMDLARALPTMIANPGQTEVEVLLLTLLGPAAEADAPVVDVPPPTVAKTPSPIYA